jgi:hypothetical protein
VSHPVLSELARVTGAPGLQSLCASLAHDVTLEPTDDTIAAVQSLVAASRQESAELGPEQLYAVICHCTRRAIETRNPVWAHALAAFALRLAEEHLL